MSRYVIDVPDDGTIRIDYKRIKSYLLDKARAALEMRIKEYEIRSWLNGHELAVSLSLALDDDRESLMSLMVETWLNDEYPSAECPTNWTGVIEKIFGAADTCLMVAGKYMEANRHAKDLP